jgi:hypothetical protein
VALLDSWWRAPRVAPNGVVDLARFLVAGSSPGGGARLLLAGAGARRVALEGGGCSSCRHLARLAGGVPEQEPEIPRDPMDFRSLRVGTRLLFSLY